MAKYSLSNNQITELKLSVNPPTGVVGYQRPLKPIQVMEYIDLLKKDGLKNDEICELIGIDKSNINNYYNRMKKLIPEVQSLVDWSRTDAKLLRLGYSAVWHYSRFGEEGQKKLFPLALKEESTRDEIRLMAQLYQRGFGSVEECFEEINQRGGEAKNQLIVGQILQEEVASKLSLLTQDERDKYFKSLLNQYFGKTLPIKFTLLPQAFYITIKKPKRTNTLTKTEEEIYLKIISPGFEEQVTEGLRLKL